MKNNTFAEDYRTFKTYEAEYKAAETKEDKKAISNKVQEFCAGIEAKGKIYSRIYTLYEEAQERGDEYIDLHDIIWDKDVKELIDGFREYGIKHFTFSATWTSTVETAWLFLQNGCTLEGMTELKGSEKIRFGHMEKEYETVPGYLFKVN